MRTMQMATLALLFVQPVRASSGFTQEEKEAARTDPKRFTVDPATVRVSRVESADGGDVGPPPGNPDPPSDGISLDKIINIASRLWKFIEDNRPVVDIRTTYAAAVPEGITHWSQLGGWSEPEGTSYRLSAKNLYGVTVIDVVWRVMRVHGGSWRGKGQYLTGVTTVPRAVDVAWGYRLNLDAAVPSVSNVGTAEDPVASMVAEVKWRIATVLKESDGTGVYYLTGDGGFREIGGPFRRAYEEPAARALSRARPKGGEAVSLQ